MHLPFSQNKAFSWSLSFFTYIIFISVLLIDVFTVNRIILTLCSKPAWRSGCASPNDATVDVDHHYQQQQQQAFSRSVGKSHFSSLHYVETVYLQQRVTRAVAATQATKKWLFSAEHYYGKTIIDMQLPSGIARYRQLGFKIVLLTANRTSQEVVW